MFARNLTLALFVAFALVPKAWALSISNVTVVNVTPSSFSVLWRTPSGLEPGVSVFQDADGAVNMAGELGVELFPIHTGSPEAANSYERRQSKSAIQSKMR